MASIERMLMRAAARPFSRAPASWPGPAGMRTTARSRGSLAKRGLQRREMSWATAACEPSSMGCATTGAEAFDEGPSASLPRERTRMIEERRKSPRHKTLKGGLIVFNSGSSSVACTIRSLSENGARLQVETVLGIPSDFTLVRDDGGAARECFVRWRSSTVLGVEFQRARGLAEN